MRGGLGFQGLGLSGFSLFLLLRADLGCRVHVKATKVLDKKHHGALRV